MNSVAASMVATIMNSNVSALRTTNLMQSSADQDFSSIIEQVNSSTTSKETTELATEAISKSSQEIVKASGDDSQVSEELQSSEAEVVSDDTEEVDNLNDKVVEVLARLDEVVAEMDVEIVTVKAVLDTEVGQEAYDEAMILISELFGVDVEQLETTIEELDVDLLDLTDKGQLLTVVQEVFGYERMSEVLLDAEATETFKAVNAEIERLCDTLEIDMESLSNEIGMAMHHGEKAEIDPRIQGPIGSTIDPVMAQESTLVSDEAVTLEVVDLRSDQDTSQLNQDNNGQNQGNQTFSELMGQQLTEINDIVETTSSEQTDFQQVRTMEIIDQLVTKAVVNLNNDNTSMQIQMNPEHLGKVAVSVTAEQGMIKGEFVAENNIVKEMIESNMVQLKEQLEQQGIKVDKIEVTLGSANQFFDQRQQNDQEQQGSNKASKRNSARIEALMQVDEEALTTTDLQPSGHTLEDAYTVEYSA